MKKTLNVNIGQTAFVIDEDAYNVLKRYLDDIEVRFEAFERTEAMADVEARIAELFSAELHSARQVVTVEMVHRAQATLGAASEFGERKSNGTYAPPPPPQNNLRSLRRSRTDRWIGGICGGVAKFFNIDPVLVRLLTFLLVFPGGLSAWVYIILWIIIPEENS